MYGTRGQKVNTSGADKNSPKNKSPMESKGASPMSRPITGPDVMETLRTQGQSLAEIKIFMERMNESLSLLNEQVAEMRTEVDDYKDIKDSLNHAHSNIADVQTDVALLGDKLKENESNYIGLQQKLSETTEENRILKEKLLHLDWYTRRENLKFKGILEDENESSLLTQRKIRDLIINKLKLDAGKHMIFQRCHRLRKTTSANADIIVRFSW